MDYTSIYLIKQKKYFLATTAPNVFLRKLEKYCFLGLVFCLFQKLISCFISFSELKSNLNPTGRVRNVKQESVKASIIKHNLCQVTRFVTQILIQFQTSLTQSAELQP